ncbi:MAG: leucyl aminopeptidase [Acidobacteriota bacterium]
MKITSSAKKLSDITEDVLVVPVFEGETPREGALAALDQLTGGAVTRVFDSGELDGKRDRWVMVRDAGRRLLLYGGGAADGLDTLRVQRLAGAAIRTLTDRGARSVAFLLSGKVDDAVCAQSIVEGAMMGQMSCGLHRSNDKPKSEVEELVLVGERAVGPAVDRAIEAGSTMAEATNFARRLGFEPGNLMTPTELARKAQEMAEREGLGCEVLGEDEMKRLGMGALLAVSRGSQEPAQLIVISYEPDGGAPDAGAPGPELIALVGKGITFDSGGISIKPADKMEDMKYDMGGGAAVIGAMQSLARLKPKARVIGLIPASENLPSGRAVKPGDVVRSLSGKTIEVVNTDAEGRLVLCDAITYAISRGAQVVVDAATLTGACVVALGEVRAAAMGTDQRLIDELISAGEKCGERVWQLPFDDEYGEMICSEIADIKNVGNRTAGSITGGWFLKHFVGDLPWAHLDIAGTAWTEHEKPYMARGATGFGVRLMANFVLNRAASK